MDGVFPLYRPLPGRPLPGATRSALAERPALDQGALHEIHAAPEDWAAALAFALLGGGEARMAGTTFLISARRTAGFHHQPCGEGLAGLGFPPDRLVLAHASDDLGLLRAGLEAARCPGIATVILETHGPLAQYDLTASRRFALAAEQSRAAVIVLRGDTAPRPSAARTRWRVTSAPSTPLEADAPGPPALIAALLRRRGGPAGGSWRLEWDAGRACFRETGDAATLPGLVVPLSRLRKPAREGGHTHAA